MIRQSAFRCLFCMAPGTRLVLHAEAVGCEIRTMDTMAIDTTDPLVGMRTRVPIHERFCAGMTLKATAVGLLRRLSPKCVDGAMTGIVRKMKAPGAVAAFAVHISE